jgi:DNA primase
VLLCEGESDALAALEPLSDSDFAALEVVAIPGTGFPIKRLVEQLIEAGVGEVFLALDGDEAGRSYSDRASATLREAGIRSIVVELEDGTDLADNLVRADDRSAWIQNALADAVAAADESAAPADPAPTSPASRSSAPLPPVSRRRAPFSAR